MAVINCPECGKEHKNEISVCESCGFSLERPTELIEEKSPVSKTNVAPVNQSAATIKHSGSLGAIVFSIICFIVSGCFFYMGYDKMTNYYYSGYDYSSLNKNAYVGGDAYNFIINGTYSTSFFVLAVGFMLAGILLIMIYYLAKLEKRI